MRIKTAVIVVLMSLALAFTAQAEEEAENPYTEIFENATEEDIRMLALVIYWESAIADCPSTTNVAVAETVLNRVLSDEFPEKTIAGICKHKGQFYWKDTPLLSDATMEAIEYVKEHGCTVLPSTDYCFFATKKQSLGQNHVWIGGRHSDGRPLKGKGMYFCQSK